MGRSPENASRFIVPNVGRRLAEPYSGMYGSEFVSARYCGFKSPPYEPKGLWQHGWIDDYPEDLPAAAVFGVSVSHMKHDRLFVATKSLARNLRSQGFSDSHAIGLPIVYVPEQMVERRSGSLIVMPVHTVPGSDHGWKISDYVAVIESIRDHFREIVVCVSPHCHANGLWVPEFRAAGFEVIQGAAASDPEALPKMARLFGRFEYVTTNGCGSVLTYAAAFGAKPSIYGPYAEYTAASLVNVPFYVDHPELAELAAYVCSERFMQSHHSELLCHPISARDQTEWGRFQIGCDNRVSPKEMRELFGWTRRDRARKVLKSISGRVPTQLRKRVKMAISSRYRAQERDAEVNRQEKRRLTELPRYTQGETQLFGCTFRFIDSESFLSTYRELFERQIYFFRSGSAAPVIIDGGANVGLSTLYFKCLYPQSRIVAFEADPEIFKVLKSNIQSFGLQGVELIPKALWNCDALLQFVQKGSSAGRLEPGKGDGTIMVATSRLRDFLSIPIDLLKLDIEGAEIPVLKDCADLLHHVQHVFVEHHGFQGQPQQLHEAIRVLEESGFRVYAESATPAKCPLIDRSLSRGMDVQTNLFGYRSVPIEESSKCQTPVRAE